MVETVELDAPGTVVVETASNIRAAIRAEIARGRFDAAPIEVLPSLMLIVCSRGRGRHMVDFVDYEVSPGTALVVRPGHVLRWELADDFDAHVVLFDAVDVPELPLLSRVFGTSPLSQLGTEQTWVEQTLGWLKEDLHANRDHAMATSVVRVVLDVIDRRAQAARPSVGAAAHRAATAFAESVDRNPHQRNVAWHAKAIGASPRSLTRATAELFGQPPKALIDARTLLEAQQRLAWTTDDVSAIAHDLGFGEATSFTRFFRMRTGMSPTSFRAGPTTS